MKDPNRASKWKNGGKKIKIERDEKRKGKIERKSSRFYFSEFINELKVFTKDVTSSLDRAEVTLFLCLKGFSLQRKHNLLQ